MRLKFQKRSALKFVSRSESQISEAQLTEICWTNYPIPINRNWEQSRIAEGIPVILNSCVTLELVLNI